VQVQVEFGPYCGFTGWAGSKNVVVGEGYSSAYFIVEAFYPEHFDEFPGSGVFFFIWDITLGEDFSYVPACNFFRPGFLDCVFDGFGVRGREAV
jgi:hypothetical protein